MEIFKSVFSFFKRYEPIRSYNGGNTKYEIHKKTSNIRKKVWLSSSDFYYEEVVGAEREFVLCYLYHRHGYIVHE